MPFAPYHYEARAWRSGLVRVAGVDEAGRGPLAGPVVAAAVIIASEQRIKGLADSKLLAPERREELFVRIQARALAVGVGIVDHETIDRVNILEATRRAMGEALSRLTFLPDLVITDFVRLAGLACPQRNLVDGDARCASVAAASIVAKVTRDRLMVAADREFPQYGFAQHKGYATPEHLAALDRHGPCPLHRRTFSGVWRQGELFPSSPAFEAASGFLDMFAAGESRYDQGVADRRHTLGQAAETAAAESLVRAGLQVLERNVRFALGELDLVCRDGDTIVFVEVKCRQARWGDAPAAAVSRTKQRRLVQLAQLYLKRRGLSEVRCRFDVVAVTEADDGQLGIRHLPGAFEAC